MNYSMQLSQKEICRLKHITVLLESLLPALYFIFFHSPVNLLIQLAFRLLIFCIFWQQIQYQWR